MSLSKEVKNFVDLQILLTKTTELIRKLFLVNWKKLYGQDWIETNHNAKVYFTNGGGTKAFAKMNSDQKQHAILGDTTKWDITLFYIILSQSNLIDKSNLKHLEKIKNIRNNVAHNSKMSLTDQQFETNWDELKNCLIQLGNDKQQVEDLKLNLNPQSVSNKVYDELKQKANDYFKEKEYTESIDFYTKALEVKNLSNDQLAVLYSNRSLVYLKLYEENQKDRDYLFKALIDAEQANIYNPKWSKTYARIGQVYTELNEYQKSIEYYSKALILDPINNEIKNSLARVKELNFEQERMSHFDNTYFPKTTEERSEETFHMKISLILKWY
ncbi:unnamed protein product [Brachionus calyciflorus]|uniref:DZIP3-like HEPN domain-containing protein n=1 Tax=Brachionus calyciflorus TaxID=104777 RepID=A0A813R9X5_9BILA|nr:unnamed protein product [Brachionus calyciflorus]